MELIVGTRKKLSKRETECSMTISFAVMLAPSAGDLRREGWTGYVKNIER
jgi:hypothetical protein